MRPRSGPNRAGLRVLRSFAVLSLFLLHRNVQDQELAFPKPLAGALIKPKLTSARYVYGPACSGSSCTIRSMSAMAPLKSFLSMRALSRKKETPRLRSAEYCWRESSSRRVGERREPSPSPAWPAACGARGGPIAWSQSVLRYGHGRYSGGGAVSDGGTTTTADPPRVSGLKSAGGSMSSSAPAGRDRGSAPR
jgi:hypothetical protein